MKEIDCNTARKLIAKKARKLINDDYFHAENGVNNVIVSPFENMQEYNTCLRWFCISEAVTYMSQSYFLPEEILEEYFEFLDWEKVLEDQILSEECIHNFRDDINWYFVCKFQDISEEFINEHTKYLSHECWNVIWQTQSLSEDFIKKNQDKFPEFVYDNTHKKDFKVYWRNKDSYQRMVKKASKIASKIAFENSRGNTPATRVPQDQPQTPDSKASSSVSSYWDSSDYSPEHIERMKRKAAERFEKEGLLASQQRELMNRLSRQLKNKRR